MFWIRNSLTIETCWVMLPAGFFIFEVKMPGKRHPIPKEGHAWCGKCLLELPKTEFHKVAKAKSGVEGYCKNCRREYHRTKYDQKPRVIPPPGHRYCPHCDTVKTEDNFHPQLLAQKHLRSLYCKKCRSDITYREPRRTDARGGGKKYGINHHSFKPLLRPATIDPLKLAYCAGIFDGEGSAQIMPTNVGTPVMSVFGDNSCILEKFRDAIAGHINYDERYKDFKDGSRAIVSNGKVLLCNLAEVHAACTALIPYLKLKADRCLLLLKSTQASPEERLVLREQIDILNAKGITEDFKIPEPRTLGLEDVKKIPEVEFSYLAGLIDAEGWVGLLGNCIVTRIGMTKSGSIQHVFNVFGGRFGISIREENQANCIDLDLRFRDRETLIFVFSKLSRHMTLKKRHVELAISAIGRSVHERRLIKIEMEALTAKNRLEKFERVKNQLEDFKKRIIYNEDGTIKEVLAPLDPEEQNPEELNLIELNNEEFQG